MKDSPAWWRDSGPARRRGQLVDDQGQQAPVHEEAHLAALHDGLLGTPAPGAGLAHEDQGRGAGALAAVDQDPAVGVVVEEPGDRVGPLLAERATAADRDVEVVQPER